MAQDGALKLSVLRGAMKGVLEKLLGVAKVKKWVYHDESREVKGFPSWIEVDIAIKTMFILLYEVKTNASDAHNTLLMHHYIRRCDLKTIQLRTSHHAYTTISC